MWSNCHLIEIIEDYKTFQDVSQAIQYVNGKLLQQFLVSLLHIVGIFCVFSFLLHMLLFLPQLPVIVADVVTVQGMNSRGTQLKFGSRRITHLITIMAASQFSGQ